MSWPQDANLTPNRIGLAAPPVPDHPPAGLRLLASLLSNPIEIWSRAHFVEPIVVNSTALGDRVVVSEPAAIKRVLVDNESNYVRDDLQRRILLRTTGHSLFSAEGEDWHAQRRLLAPLFTRKRLDGYIPGMEAAAVATTARLAGLSSCADMSTEMARTAIDVLTRTILPDTLEEDLGDVARTIRKFADGAGSITLADLLGLPPWIPGLRRLRAYRATRTVDTRARRIVAKRKGSRQEDASGHDLLSLLLAARTSGRPMAMTEQDIEDNVSTFLGAGSDTVASLLTWSLYLLSRSPHIRDAVECELDHIGGGPVTPDLVDRLPLTRPSSKRRCDSIRRLPCSAARPCNTTSCADAGFLPAASSSLPPGLSIAISSCGTSRLCSTRSDFLAPGATASVAFHICLSAPGHASALE